MTLRRDAPTHPVAMRGVSPIVMLLAVGSLVVAPARAAPTPPDDESAFGLYHHVSAAVTDAYASAAEAEDYHAHASIFIIIGFFAIVLSWIACLLCQCSSWAGRLMCNFAVDIIASARARLSACQRSTSRAFAPCCAYISRCCLGVARCCIGIANWLRSIWSSVEQCPSRIGRCCPFPERSRRYAKLEGTDAKGILKNSPPAPRPTAPKGTDAKGILKNSPPAPRLAAPEGADVKGTLKTSPTDPRPIAAPEGTDAKGTLKTSPTNPRPIAAPEAPSTPAPVSAPSCSALALVSDGGSPLSMKERRKEREAVASIARAADTLMRFESRNSKRQDADAKAAEAQQLAAAEALCVKQEQQAGKAQIEAKKAERETKEAEERSQLVLAREGDETVDLAALGKQMADSKARHDRESAMMRIVAYIGRVRRAREEAEANRVREEHSPIKDDIPFFLPSAVEPGAVVAKRPKLPTKPRHIGNLYGIFGTPRSGTHPPAPDGPTTV